MEDVERMVAWAKATVIAALITAVTVGLTLAYYAHRLHYYGIIGE